MTYEASTRRVPCISSTLDETTALRPFCDSSLHLMTTNWTRENWVLERGALGKPTHLVSLGGCSVVYGKTGGQADIVW